MFSRLGIGAKLTLAFGALAAVTVLVVLAGFIAGGSVMRDLALAEAARLPGSLTSAQAQASLLRMQLHVRGYLVLGSHDDIEQYQQQKLSFEKSLASLQAMARTWPQEEAGQVAQLVEDYQRWVQLPQKLFDLHDNPLQNRPALRLARFDVQPRRVDVLNQLNAIIAAQRIVGPRSMPEQGADDLLSELTGFESSFDAMVTNLVAFAASGELSFKLAFAPQLASNNVLWQAISRQQRMLPEVQRQRLVLIEQRRAEIAELAVQIMNVGGGEHAYEDLYIFRAEAEPQAQNMLRVLATLTANQQAGLQSDLGRARERVGRASIPAALAGLLAIGLAVALTWVAQRRIAGPVRRLTALAEQVAGGDLAAPERGAPRDEIGRLAHTLNTRLRKDELRQLMASITDFVWSAEVISGGSLAYRYFSPVVERIAGRPPSYFLASPERWAEIVCAEDRAALTAGLQRVATGAADRTDAEYRIASPAGGLRWVRDSVRSMRLEDGRLLLNGVVSDISDRKAAEAALRDSEARFRSLTDLSSDWYWRQDEQLRFTDLSQEVNVRAGFTADSSVGRTRWELTAITPLSGSWEEHKTVLAQHQTFRDFEYFRLGADGVVHYISVSGAPIFDERGRFKGYQGVGRDITERKRIEEELRARQQMLDLAQKAAQAVAFEINVREERIYWTPDLEAMHGVSAGSHDGSLESWKGLIHPGDWPELNAALEHARESGEVAVEYRVVHPDGAVRWLQAKGKLFFDAAGAASRMVGFLLDVTDRHEAEEEVQRLERQLRQAQRLEAMGTLAGGIAHDFNNILAAILGYGEMALRDAPKSSRVRRDLDNIIAAGERGRTLVDRILAFSRSGVGERVLVHVEQIVNEALDLIDANLPNGVTIERDLHAGRAAMLGDPTQVHQVLMNLATNAVQAMPAGGTLRVTLDAVQLPVARSVTTGTVAAGDYIVLTVADQGVGIAPEIMERIFDPFFTTKEVGVGTGLGLSLVHGIVSEEGGGVDVKSEPGTGSTFTVYLPRAGDAAEDIESDVFDLPRGDGQQVLIVDDEELLARLATENLAELGYVPIAFNSSTAALAAYRAHPERYDAVITDERMPGLTGSALIREIRELSSVIPILLVSGFVSAETLVRAREAGADEVLKKPLSRRDLATTLARVLGRA